MTLEIPPVIRFYIREEPYGFLSNFWRHKQDVNGITYQTNEHYYQSMKTCDTELRHWIRNAPSAKMAMKIGRLLEPDQMNKDWEYKKVDIMANGLVSKFNDPNMRLLLAWTGDAKLIEYSPTDMFWGGRLMGSKNMLGKLLMAIREDQKVTRSPIHMTNVCNVLTEYRNSLKVE